MHVSYLLTFQSEKSIELRSELHGDKFFSASINSGTSEHVNVE